MRAIVSRITRERKQLATCGFHHSKENTGARKCMEKFDWSIIDQSGERPLDILRKAFGTLFSFDFGLKYDHSIGKIVLFRST